MPLDGIPITPPPTTPTVDQQILTTATGPKSISVDGMTVTSPDVADVIAADRYLAQKASRKKNPFGRRVKFLPPSAL